LKELCCRGALEQWVGGYYGGNATAAHPLLPHFALDAAQFVLAHAYGNRKGGSGEDGLPYAPQ